MQKFPGRWGRFLEKQADRMTREGHTMIVRQVVLADCTAGSRAVALSLASLNKSLKHMFVHVPKLI